MSYWLNKVQRLTNYFPESYSVRSDKFSLGSMFFNSVANQFYHDADVVERYLSDLVPGTKLAERPQEGYRVETSFAIDSTTDMVVTGYCGTTGVSGVCDVFVTMAEALEDLHFGVPDTVILKDSTSKRLDFTWEVTGRYCDYSIESELDYDLPNHLEIYVSGYPVWSSTIPIYSKAYLKLTGLIKEYPNESTEEQILVPGDSIYVSSHSWLYLESIEAFGLEGVTIICRAPGYGFPYRLANDDYFVPEYRNPIDARLTCDTGVSGIFTQYSVKIEPTVEWYDEPAHVFQVVDQAGSPVAPLDFAVSPGGNQLAVVNNSGVINIYDMRELLPDSISTIIKLPTCPYHLTFEFHSQAAITVKLWNKYLNNPFDYNMAIVVQDPSGYRWLLDGDGNRYVDEGQYLTAATYPKRFVYTARQFGPHIFYIKYYDTETYSHKSQAYLYNFEQKIPIYTFTATNVVGLSWVRDNTLGVINTSGDVLYYSIINYNAFYETNYTAADVNTIGRTRYITFFNIIPDYITYQGITECTVQDPTPTGSYVQFGNLIVLGEL